MDTSRVHSIFKSAKHSRDKFLSRLFGIFSEDIVRIWCQAEEAPFEDLGRPWLQCDVASKLYQLDFTLRSKSDGRIYVCEMKCELEYDSYRRLSLTSPTQLKHHVKPAFKAFLQAAIVPEACVVEVNKIPQAIAGAVLIWGHCTEEGREAVIAQYGLHTVLSINDMIEDLISWRNQEFTAFVDQREAWCRHLFAGLRSGIVAME